jgi:S1-C subfamily serine protease
MSALDGRDLDNNGSADGVTFRVMRTDAAINHGNSGGALFNAKGELIGITNAKNVDDETDNMGYALPITQVKYLCDNLLDNGGVVKRAMLGVMVKATASEAVYENGRLNVYEEFIVDSTAIAPESAAYNKLQFGDQFKAITIIHKGETEGKTTTFARRYQLNDLLLTVRKGDKIILKVIHYYFSIGAVAETFAFTEHFCKFTDSRFWERIRHCTFVKLIHSFLYITIISALKKKFNKSTEIS